MPVYEYRCVQCGAEFERIRSIAQSDEPGPCPQCGGTEIKRCLSLFSAAGRSEGETRSIGGSSGCASCTATSCDSCRG